MTLRIFVAALLLTPALARSQTDETQAAAADAPFKATATVGWVPDFDLDSGGKAGATLLQLSLSGTRQLDASQRLGFAVQYGRQDWSFDDPQAWGTDSPWDALSRISLSVPYSHVNTANGWAWSVIPAVDFSSESGAGGGDSFSYGMNAGLVRFLARDKMIGGGVAIWQRLDGFQAFPYLVIDWKLSEHWKLVNPFAASVVGPAGLEAVWSPKPGFEMGFGATWREYEWRLADDNPVAPGGILVDSTIPVYLRAETEFTESASLSFYLGVGLGGEFEFLDADENTVSTEEHSLMPIVGLTYSGQF